VLSAQEQVDCSKCNVVKRARGKRGSKNKPSGNKRGQVNQNRVLRNTQKGGSVCQFFRQRGKKKTEAGKGEVPGVKDTVSKQCSDEKVGGR